MKAMILTDGPDLRFPAAGDVGKAMVEIGGRPLVWHIMKIYSAHGISDFVLCCGANAPDIKDFFANYALRTADVTFDLSRKSTDIHDSASEDWRVTVVDTSVAVSANEKLKRLAAHLEGEEAFCLSYGDSLASIDIGASIAFHRSHGQLATVSAVYPPARYGALHLKGVEVNGLSPRPEAGFINGGFLVLSPTCLEAFVDDGFPEHAPNLQALAEAGHLKAYRHEGFWQPVDTLQDILRLENLWQDGMPLWKVW